MTPAAHWRWWTGELRYLLVERLGILYGDRPVTDAEQAEVADLVRQALAAWGGA